MMKAMRRALSPPAKSHNLFLFSVRVLMKLGVFDSGLGGLVIAKAIGKALPAHDMVYLGDTLHVPYGSRSLEAVTHYTQRSIDYLFRKADCKLIIMACNTASAIALRNLQQNYLVKNYPDRRILGVVVPTLETALEEGHSRIGLLATERIVRSSIYKTELEKIGRGIKLFQKSAPLLVPAIELNTKEWIRPLLREYIKPLLAQNIECLILGCTHYAFLKNVIQKKVGKGVHVMSQDDIIPGKLVDYLKRHPEIDRHITRRRRNSFLVTDITDSYIRNARSIYKKDIDIKKVVI